MKCSTLIVVLTAMLALFSGAAYGQSSTVNLFSVSGTIGSDGPDADNFPDFIKIDTNIVFTIRYTNNTGFNMVAATNGWTVYSPDGAVWDSTKLDTLALTGPGWLARSDLAFGFYPIDTPNVDDPPSEGTDSNGFVANGAAPDTVGLNLASNTSPHFENNFNQNAVTITLKAINDSHHGKHICLDSSVYDVAVNTWLWALTGGGSSVPIWGGPFCFQIIDPNAPPDLILSQDSLHFSSVQGGPAPAFQEFAITSSTPNVVPFTLSENAPWLIVSPINASTPRTIRVDINNIGLIAGDYIDTIIVNSAQAANTPLYVVVTLTVAPPPPTIAFSPTAFFFNALANDTNPDPKILTIENSGGSVLNWTVSKTQPWLTLIPTFGTDSGDVEVAIDITGLTLGTYRDTITITAPGATNTPRKVPVTLSVASDLPLIEVDSLFNFVIVESGQQGFDSAYFGIRNGGGGTMDFWLEWNSPRLFEIIPDSGTAPQTVKVRIKIASGTVGNDYYDTVWVYSNQAINSPVPVVMFLHYVANPAVISIVPPSLNYTLFECAQGLTGIPPELSFTIDNGGGDDPMLFNIIYESDLFTVSPTSGSALSFIEVHTIDPKLPVGVYKDTIYIYAQNALNNPYKLEVTLNVIAGTTTPQIFTMDSTWTMTAQEDFGPILPIYFIIQNKFGGCMEWHIDNDIPWVSVLDSVGDVPDTLGIFASAFGMTIGQYIDTFYITSPVASNNPKKMVLTFKVWKLHGDNNYDGTINILDLVHVVDYMFRGSGIEPQPERLVGDVNCDGRYNIQDLTIMVDFLFRTFEPICGNPVK